MQAQGIVPAEIRQTMRTEIMKQAVLEGEVDSKLFYGVSVDELHKYFDAHRDKFVTPESVELSEIFLSLAGKQEASVKTQATQLVDQLRKGADFATIAKDYRDAVMPLLKIKTEFIVEKNGDDKKAPEKKKGKLLGIFPKP